MNKQPKTSKQPRDEITILSSIIIVSILYFVSQDYIFSYIGNSCPILQNTYKTTIGDGNRVVVTIYFS